MYFSLLIPADLLSTPIPEIVLQELQPPKWKKRLIVFMIGKAGLLNPKDSKFNMFEYVLFNTLLYDSFSDLFIAIFPPLSYMNKRYGCTNSLSFFYSYCQRICDLTFRRLKT